MQASLVVIFVQLHILRMNGENEHDLVYGFRECKAPAPGKKKPTHESVG
jgi:hypothetical protein